MTVTVEVDATLTLDVQVPGDLAVCLAATSPVVTESLVASSPSGTDVPLREVRQPLSRTHVLRAPIGETRVTYRASIQRASQDATALTDAEALVYRRPSRYCPSDRLAGLAAAEFGGLDARSCAFAVEQWIHDTVAYVPGVTDAVDDALHPLLARTGVCRDFAHLGVALCRAVGIPSRYTAVYAPGLDPMDVHAVFEAAIDHHWYVFDATRLAPRPSLVRIGSGRDAADVALVTSAGSALWSMAQHLTVTSTPVLPTDDRQALAVLP